MNPLVLASTSKYKRTLFKQLGLPFQWADPEIEEVFDPGLKPREQAAVLASQKAQAVESRFRDATIIGADQVLAFGDTILTKPGTKDKAVQQLELLRGHEHCLHTAVCILETKSGRSWTQTVTSTLKMAENLTTEYLREVVERDQTWDCVGAYKLESLGVTLFETIDTEDATSIVGLPLLSISTYLRDKGYFIG